MRYLETAKLAAGIDPGKKFLGGKRPPFSHEWLAFFLIRHRGRECCHSSSRLLFKVCDVSLYGIDKCYGVKKIGNPDTFETIRFAQNKAPQRFQKRVLLSSVPDGVGQLPMLKLSVEKHPGFSHWFES